MQPWIGYALWYVAQAKGIFAKHGLTRVDFVNYSDDAADLAIMASGAVEATSAAVQNVLQHFQTSDEFAVVMLEDTSTTADAVLASQSVKSIADLRGKSVGYEQGSTSHLLIASALSAAGLDLTAIKSVNMPAAQAAAALIAGRIDAAVTYEPYVSTALQARTDLQRLYTAGQSPGLISDCLLVTRKALVTRPGQIAAILRSWDDAQSEYQRNPAQCQAIMAKGVGAELENLSSTFAGVHYYSLKESQLLLPGNFSQVVLPQVNSLSVELGLIKNRVASSKVVDMNPLDSL